MDANDTIRMALKKGGQDQPSAPGKRKRERYRGGGSHESKPEKKKKASGRSTAVAEHWISLANAHGIEPPFNANWLALQIADKVNSDPAFREERKIQNFNGINRWLIKMCDKFWGEYVDASVPAKNVGSVFLVEAWDAVRDYAWDCLRAVYLRDHGVRLPHPQYPGSEALHEALRQVDRERKFKKILETEERPVNTKRLDDHRMSVLKSAREKRGNQ